MDRQAGHADNRQGVGRNRVRVVDRVQGIEAIFSAEVVALPYIPDGRKLQLIP